MQEAELPEREQERIEALRECSILDTLPEQAYDDVTYIASRLCETPIALVSLVDEERQWFKSRVGLDVQETPRALAFCSHAILEPTSLFEIPDAARDARFADSPLVTGDPRIRFYAGAPLVTSDGHALGTLCVIDHQPRELSDDQRESLRALSRQVVAHLELRRAACALEAANHALERRSSQLERSRDEMAALCRTLEGQAEVIERDLQRAEVIQRSLLPSQPPRVAGYRVEALYRPGHRIGGDLYDVVPVSDGGLALTIADAAGHGVSAAMLSVLFKHRLRLVDASGAPRRPADVLASLDRALRADVSAPGMFVTAAVAQFDPRAGRLRVAGAGHPPLLVLRAKGESETWGATGPALGLYPDAAWSEIEIELLPGDRVLFYTDGIIESAEDPDDALERAAELLQERSGDDDALEALLAQLAGGGSGDRDDVTLLLLDTSPGESRFREVTRAAGEAREAAAQQPPIGYGETEDGTWLGLHGRVGWTWATLLLGAASAVIDAGRALWIDLRPCTHLDSTLLGTLHEVVMRAEAAGVPVHVCAPSPRLLAAFRELSLKHVLDHVCDPPESVPEQTTRLSAPGADPRSQQLRLLKAHEMLAELSDENRAEMEPVLDALRREIARS